MNDARILKLESRNDAFATAQPVCNLLRISYKKMASGQSERATQAEHARGLRDTIRGIRLVLVQSLVKFWVGGGGTNVHECDVEVRL